MKIAWRILLIVFLTICQASLAQAARRVGNDTEYYKRMYDEYKTQRHLPDDYDPWKKDQSRSSQKVLAAQSQQEDTENSFQEDIVIKQSEDENQESENRTDESVPSESVKQVKKNPSPQRTYMTPDYYSLRNSFEPKTHSFDLWTEFSYIRYEEPDFMEETGAMFGFGGLYQFYFQENNSLMIDGRVSFGQLDYDSNGSGTIDDINNVVVETRLSVGHDFNVLSQSKVTPYIGVGYRYLSDQLGGQVSSVGAVGYDRESNYVYLPIGVTSETELTNDWSLGLNVEYDVFLAGFQKSHLEDVFAGLDTLENDQTDGFGVRGSIKLLKKSDMFNLYFEPFVRYWSIDQSDVGSVTFGGNPIGVFGYEPENTSMEYGLKVGINY